ncbi:MAG: hypothetical protein ACE5J2_04000 [Nitrososphaerales archaeon]
MSFTSLLDELRIQLEDKRSGMQSIVAKNPQQVYKELNEIANMVGSKYGVLLQLHFPDAKKMNDVESYGMENIGILVDKHRKRFSIPRDTIKEKARELLGKVDTEDAYMYEGKEGLKIFLQEGRMDVLPGLINLWCRLDDKIKKFVDWLMVECYGIKTN